MKKVLLWVSLLATLSCHKNESVQPVFDVTVQNFSSDCGLPVLDFGIHAGEVQKLAGVSGGACLLYYALNLDSTYAKAGAIISVKIRKVQPNEDFPCTDRGSSYPKIAIISAQIK